MYGCLQRADGLLLEDIAGEEEEGGEYADLTGLVRVVRCEMLRYTHQRQKILRRRFGYW